MTEFNVTFINVTSVAVTVEADSIEEATEIAHDKGLPSLCHQCAERDDGEWELDAVLDENWKVLEEFHPLRGVD